MQRTRRRRAYLRRLGTVVAVGGLASVPATADECDATIYRNATRDGEETVEVPSGEAKITGESTCETGAELAVRASKSGGSSPFVKQAITTVGDTGGFTATFDFANQDPGTTFTLSVEHDDETLDSVGNAVIAESAATPHPTPTPTPTPTPSPTPTPTPSPTPTATPTNTPTDEAGTAPDGAADATATGAAGGATGTVSDGTPGTDESTSTSTGAPGFEFAVAVGGLALAAWRLLDDR